MSRPAEGLPRRRFLRLVGAGAVAGTFAGHLDGATASLPPTVARAMPRVAPSAALAATTTIHLAATDGWLRFPGSVPGIHPDPMAPSPLTTWALGFIDVTGLTSTQMNAQRGHVQAAAPILWVDQDDVLQVKLTNLGLQVRPDLTDSHTIHWHGFRNAIPLFDGVPELSISVPISRTFTYYYNPHDEGTYMYHCHFEDVEHVSMGMDGIVFVRPKQNRGNALDGNGDPIPAGKYAYNDGVQPGARTSTAYDREWTLMLTEAWTQERFDGAHIQEHDWSEYAADLWLMNGRCYPDTLAPNGGGRNLAGSGDLIPPSGHPELQYQPISSLIRCNSGDRVLLRIANLGFGQQTLALAGLTARIVGQDATLLRGRDGTDNTVQTSSLHIGPGESIDAIFTAPNVSSETTYLLYNRDLATLRNPGQSGLGGQATEIRVLPAANPLPPQTTPNT